IRNANVRRPYLALTAAALHYRPIPELRLTVGKQIVNWDNFDGIQPANLLSSLDQSDPFRGETQGVNGLTLHWQPSAFYADLTVVPLAFAPARSPQNRWIIIPGAVGYHQHLPPVQVDETQAGLRLGGRLGDLDASAFGYVGRDALRIYLGSPDRNRGDFVDSLIGGEYTYGDWRFVLGYLRQDLKDRPQQSVLSQG